MFQRYKQVQGTGFEGAMDAAQSRWAIMARTRRKRLVSLAALKTSQTREYYFGPQMHLPRTSWVSQSTRIPPPPRSSPAGSCTSSLGRSHPQGWACLSHPSPVPLRALE